MFKTMMIFILLVAQISFAAATVTPALQKNFTAAQSVFQGRVKLQNQQNSEPGKPYMLELEVVKIWKGSPANPSIGYHVDSKSDTIGKDGAPGAECVIFLDAKENIMGGRDASFCTRQVTDKEGVPSKQRIVDFDKKIQPLLASPKK